MKTDPIDNILKQTFHLSQFRKGQSEIIQSVIAYRDAMAVMPTGGGKSLCYQLPALYFQGLVIVVSPLIALMKDQVRTLRQLNIRAGAIHSGQDIDEKRQIFSDLRTSGPYILYVSPERTQSPGFIHWLQQQNVHLFAIDEAHCLSQWGPDFRQDYHKLNLLRQLKPNVPILALTATATPTVLNDIQRHLELKSPDKHVYGFYRPNIYYQIEICPDDAAKTEWLESAIRQNLAGRILIYCGTRQQTETVAATLQSQFVNVGYYHAGLSAEERKRTQEQMDQGQIRILSATNAFGMGIDYPDVRLVVHMQMPATIESLYQEVGRAGRDGQMSTGLLLQAKKDRGLHSYFIQQSKAQAAVIRHRWNSLAAITQFVESAECRHAGILTYFRDSERIARCGHCDICNPTSPLKVQKPQTRSSRPIKKKKNSLLFPVEPTPELQSRILVLKDWRREYAKSLDLPAFVVFSDKTLRDLAMKNPKDLDELHQVYGFGPSKVEQMGPHILKILGQH